MGGVLVVAELRRGELRPVTAELIAAGVELSRAGAGPLAVALVGHAPERHVAAVSAAGVEEVCVVATPQEHFEPHVQQAAIGALIELRSPALVLAGHTIDSLGFAPALAARAGLGFAADVTAASWSDGAVRARRGAYGQKLVAELEFPGKQTVVLLMRPGAVEPAGSEAGDDPGSGAARVTPVDVELAGAARSEHAGFRDPQSGDLDITKADFLLSIGRGVEDADRIPELEGLAQRMGATLSASRPLVDAGWVRSERQVGQSGRTVTPKVYLALGISGAVQHLVGMSKAQTIIAVNSDPEAPIFSVAQYGAVADLFEVAVELERQFG